MILAYRIFTNILYPFLILFIYFRVLIKKEDPIRYKEKILVKFFNYKSLNKTKLIWFHAASIGEFKSIIPLIEKMNTKYNIFEYLITTNTLSSGNIAKIELKRFKNVQHRFMPLDVNHLIKKFLKTWKPERIFLVDSEIWPNLIISAKQYKIPISLINARLTKKSFRRWMFFSKTAEKIFKLFDLCLCSNKETKNYLEMFNAKNIKYEGNIKLINEINEKDFESKNNEKLSKYRLWVAASIHKDEGIFCLKTHIELKKSYNDVITIIAPRHLTEVSRIKVLADKFKLKTQILNKDEEILEGINIIIINYYGGLQRFFKFSKSVFVGKSLLLKLKNDSGQNPIDAAKLNCRIYHGPYVSNFQEIYDILDKNNISKKIEDFDELSKHLVEDLGKDKKNHEKPIFMKKLEQKILLNTIKLIDDFLNVKPE